MIPADMNRLKISVMISVVIYVVISVDFHRFANSKKCDTITKVQPQSSVRLGLLD